MSYLTQEEVFHVEVGVFEQNEIKRYFRLDTSIKELKSQIIDLRGSFYDQTLATRTTHNDTELVTVGFDVERNVIPFLETLSLMERRLERCTKKEQYFNDYLNSISSSDRSYLVSRYRNNIYSKVCQIDVDVYNEIEEINEAINYMYGFPQGIKQKDIELKGASVNERVNHMAKLLGV